jgi:hypothetical protein
VSDWRHIETLACGLRMWRHRADDDDPTVVLCDDSGKVPEECDDGVLRLDPSTRYGIEIRHRGHSRGVRIPMINAAGEEKNVVVRYVDFARIRMQDRRLEMM